MILMVLILTWLVDETSHGKGFLVYPTYEYQIIQKAAIVGSSFRSHFWWAWMFSLPLFITFWLVHPPLPRGSLFNHDLGIQFSLQPPDRSSKKQIFDFSKKCNSFESNPTIKVILASILWKQARQWPTRQSVGNGKLRMTWVRKSHYIPRLLEHKTRKQKNKKNKKITEKSRISPNANRKASIHHIQVSIQNGQINN